MFDGYSRADRGVVKLWDKKSKGEASGVSRCETGGTGKLTLGEPGAGYPVWLVRGADLLSSSWFMVEMRELIKYRKAVRPSRPAGVLALWRLLQKLGFGFRAGRCMSWASVLSHLRSGWRPVMLLVSHACRSSFSHNLDTHFPYLLWHHNPPGFGALLMFLFGEGALFLCCSLNFAIGWMAPCHLEPFLYPHLSFCALNSMSQPESTTESFSWPGESPPSFPVGC